MFLAAAKRTDTTVQQSVAACCCCSLRFPSVYTYIQYIYLRSSPIFVANQWRSFLASRTPARSMADGWWLIFDPQPQLPHDMAALLMTVVCRKGAEGIGVSNNNNDAHQFDWLVIMIGSGPSLFLAHSLPVAPLLPHVFRVELHWTWSWIVGNSKKRKHIFLSHSKIYSLDL